MIQIAARLCLCVFLVGCAPTVVWHGRSPDRAQRVVVVEEERRQRVVLDGSEQEAWDAIAVSHLRWTDAAVPGAAALIYPARASDGWHLVVDGRAGAAHRGIGFIHPFGEHLAYAAEEADGWHVVIDGVVGPAFVSLRAAAVVSEEGRIAYIGRDAAGEHVVVDGAVGPAFDIVQALQFGAKGAVLAYVGYDASGARVVVDGAPSHRGTFVDVHELAVASDEPRWAAIVSRGEASEIFLDAERVAEATAASQLTLSADGAHVAWVVSTDDAEEVWLDGARRGTYRAVDQLRFVPGTGRLLHVVSDEDGDGLRVVYDGARGPRFDDVEGPTVSRSGHWGYVGIRRVGCAAVVDGQLVHRGEWAGALALAERGERWALLARQAGRRFVLTPEGSVDVPRPVADTFVLDADGAHWGLVVANVSAHRLDVLVDGRVTAPLDLDEVSAAEVLVDRDGGGGPDARAIVRSIVSGELNRRAREGDRGP